MRIPELGRVHAIGIPVVLALLLFLPTVSYPFVGDDLDILVGNPAVTAPASWTEPFTVPYWNTPTGRTWGYGVPAPPESSLRDGG